MKQLLVGVLCVLSFFGSGQSLKLVSSEKFPKKGGEMKGDEFVVFKGRFLPIKCWGEINKSIDEERVKASIKFNGIEYYVTALDTSDRRDKSASIFKAPYKQCQYFIYEIKDGEQKRKEFNSWYDFDDCLFDTLSNELVLLLKKYQTIESQKVNNKKSDYSVLSFIRINGLDELKEIEVSSEVFGKDYMLLYPEEEESPSFRSMSLKYFELKDNGLRLIFINEYTTTYDVSLANPLDRNVVGRVESKVVSTNSYKTYRDLIYLKIDLKSNVLKRVDIPRYQVAPGVCGGELIVKKDDCLYIIYNDVKSNFLAKKSKDFTKWQSDQIAFQYVKINERGNVDNPIILKRYISKQDFIAQPKSAYIFGGQIIIPFCQFFAKRKVRRLNDEKFMRLKINKE